MKLSQLILGGIAALGLWAHADAKTLVNVDSGGVGIQGYDPVGFFSENKPVKGDPKHQVTHDGVKYHFASDKNKAAFEANPSKYTPEFGGYCAYGVSKGAKAPIEVDAFQIVNGRLLLQYDKSIRDKFNKDTSGNLKLADEKWPTVVDKFGK